MDPLEETINCYDANAASYAEKWLNSPVMQEDLDLFIKNLPGIYVLDAGCGPGRDAFYFTEQGLEVDGIDLSEELLKIAKAHAPEAVFYFMDMRDLDFEDEFHDGVWACASLLHLDRREVPRALMEFWRVLVPGGILYVSVKEGTGEAWVESDNGRIRYTYFSEEELKGLLEFCGFEIFHFTRRTGHATFISFWARKVQF